MSLSDDILIDIRPDQSLREEVKAVSEEILGIVREESKKYVMINDVRLVGSVAKDTYVSRPDIDVFMLFDESIAKHEMDRIGLDIGKKVLSLWEERYAEHPYIHGSFKSYEIDIVPCYHIKETSKLLSAVDRTPFHTDYIKSKLSEDQKDQVRLLKQFLKGISAYGAEAKVQGFSGYLVELMVIHYGNFDSVVLNASKWRYRTRIDIVGNGTVKFDSPLVVYDPVDPKRNVASALSIEKFNLFIYACGQYLNNPTHRFFFPEIKQDLSNEDIRNLLSTLGYSLLSVKFDRPDLIDDNLFPQVRKTLDGILVQVGQNGFNVLDRGFFVRHDDVIMIFLLESDTLSRYRKHFGPPVWIPTASNFVEKWAVKGVVPPFIEGERWVAFVNRGFTTAKESLMLTVPKASLGSAFKGIQYDVFDNEETLAAGYEQQLTMMLDKRMPWEV